MESGERAFEFTKMSGAGNDFIVVDNRSGAWTPEELSHLARGLCRRGLSVGADGLIAVENSKRVRFRVRIFNPDGGEAALCGNGGRCAARFAFIRVIAGRQMAMEAPAGVLQAEVLPDGAVRLEMPGRPTPPKPITLQLERTSVGGYLVEVGVPHLVVFVRDIDKVDVATLGGRLRSHASVGAEGANVDFVGAPEAGGTVPIRTFERGVEAETLACGTGAAAVGWVLHHTGNRPTSVALRMRSGKVLGVEVRPAEGRLVPSITIAGEAAVIYQGRLSEEALREALSC